MNLNNLPVISNGHPERVGAEAGHGRVGQIIHHPVNILFQEDGHVAGQQFKRLPVLYDGGIWKNRLHQVGGQIKPVDGRVVQTDWGRVEERGLNISIQTQVGQSEFEVFGSEANQKNTLWKRKRFDILKINTYI